jgi:hypothetical protein
MKKIKTIVPVGFFFSFLMAFTFCKSTYRNNTDAVSSTLSDSKDCYQVQALLVKIHEYPELKEAEFLCNSSRCFASIKILRIIERAANNYHVINAGDTLTGFFRFGLEKSESADGNNVSISLPGLNEGDSFIAPLCLQIRLGNTKPLFFIYEYQKTQI